MERMVNKQEVYKYKKVEYSPKRLIPILPASHMAFIFFFL
jgi:hypothetical protein